MILSVVVVQFPFSKMVSFCLGRFSDISLKASIEYAKYMTELAVTVCTTEWTLLLEFLPKEVPKSKQSYLFGTKTWVNSISGCQVGSGYVFGGGIIWAPVSRTCVNFALPRMGPLYHLYNGYSGKSFTQSLCCVQQSGIPKVSCRWDTAFLCKLGSCSYKKF